MSARQVDTDEIRDALSVQGSCERDVILALCDALDAARAEVARWRDGYGLSEKANARERARAEKAEAQLAALTEFLDSEEQPYPGRVLPLGCVSIRVVRRVLKDAT